MRCIERVCTNSFVEVGSQMDCRRNSLFVVVGLASSTKTISSSRFQSAS
jgi:hypothetical protein